MMGVSHRTIGAATGFSFAMLETGNHLLSYPVFGIGCTVLGAIGALAPDLDHANSTATKHVGIVARIFSSFVTHRGMTHSILAVYLLYLVSTHMPYSMVTMAFIAGYVSHIIADIPFGGVSLFWPIKTRIGFGLFKTGGLSEKIVAPILTSGILIYPVHQNILKMIMRMTS